MIRNTSVTLLFIFLIFTSSVFAQNDLSEKKSLMKRAFRANYMTFYNMLNSENPQRLYNIEVYSIYLLEAAVKLQDTALLDSLAILYNIPFGDTVKSQKYYLPYNAKIDTLKLKRPYSMWLNKTSYKTDSITNKVQIEVILNSAQFAYLIVHTIHSSLSLDDSIIKSARNLDSLINNHWNMLVYDQYYRWIFGEKLFNMEGWGCIKGNYNNSELLDLKKNEKFRKKVAHCKAVTDCDLWIMTGVAEILMTNKLNPEKYPLQDSIKQSFKDYLQKGLNLVQSRFSKVKTKDFNGNKVIAYQFDTKAWVDHIDNVYAHNVVQDYPNDYKTKRLKHIGWDISHARRLVLCLESFYQYHREFNTTFPDSSDMNKIASNFIYNVFNGDYKNPLFTNYMDGSNGWYRFGYRCPECGYAPYDLAISAVTGGFFIWEKYNKDISPLKNIMYNQIKNKTDHWKKYYGRYYEKGERTKAVDPMNIRSYDSIILLEFLPIFFIL